MSRIAQNPDDLYGDAPIAQIHILVRRNGSMSTGGDIGDLHYALAMLDHAKDAVRQYHSRMTSGKHAYVPALDIELPKDRKVIIPA